jgi:uncharacterized membrane protein
MAMLATAYFSLLVAMAVLDGCWLGFIAKDFYRRSLGHLMADRINAPAALGFYLLYAAGLTFMAVRPMLETGDWRGAAYRGGALGLFAYMTYDLSNLATLKGVPAGFAIVDILWGGVISAAVCACAVFVTQRVFG